MWTTLLLNTRTSYARFALSWTCLILFSELCMLQAKQISIDEELVKFKGRVSFRQYPHFHTPKWAGKFSHSMILMGIKFSTSVGVYCILRQVSQLVPDFMDKGFQIFLNKPNTSIPLCKFLLKCNTAACAEKRGLVYGTLLQWSRHMMFQSIDPYSGERAKYFLSRPLL